MPLRPTQRVEGDHPAGPPLWARVLRLIIDIAAPSVARYGPVEVLRLPVGRPPDDETNRPSMDFAVS